MPLPITLVARLGKVQKRQQLQRRAQIFNLQHQIQKGLVSGELPPLNEETFHHFARGLYAREMRIKADSLVVGKIHRYPCLNFIMEGIAEVRTDQGAFRVEAPCVFESGSGTKRAIYAVTDLTWITAHPSNNRNLDDLERELIADTYDDLPRMMLEADL